MPAPPPGLIPALEAFRAATAEQEALAAAFTRVQEDVKARMAIAEHLPPVEYRGPAPAEQCVTLSTDELEKLQLSDALFCRLPLETIPAVAALLGVVALGAVRQVAKPHARAFGIHHFVPRSHSAVQQFRREEDARLGLMDDLDRPDLDDEDDFGHALDFTDDTFSKLEAYALDDVFLAMRHKSYETRLEHRNRMNWFFENTFLHLGDADAPQHAVALQRRCCRHFPKVSTVVFPNHIYTPPGIFCPRPLHVAVLVEDLPMARLLIIAALKSGCHKDIVFLLSHTPTTNWGEMSPLFLALLVLDEGALRDWLDLLCAAGSRLNHMDWHLYGVIKEAEINAAEEVMALEARLRLALEMSGASAYRRRLRCKQPRPQAPSPIEVPGEAWA